MLSPLIVLPTLSRYLDQSSFSYYLYLISLGSWMAVIVEFGFILSATRDIACNNVDKLFCQEKLYSVASAKIILSIILLFITLIFTMYSTSMVYFLGWIYAVLLGFNYTWFFQGVRKLKVPLIAEFLGVIILILGVFILVCFGKGINWIIFVLFFSRVVSLIIYILLLKYTFRFRALSFKFVSAIEEIKKSFFSFLLISFVSFYTTFNVVYLGWVTMGVQLIYFAGAEKLIRAGCSLISPISQAFLPEMTIRFREGIESGLKLFKYMMIFVTTIGLFMYLGILIFSKLFIYLFLGKEYIYAQEYLIILGLMLPAVGLSSVLNMHFLVPFGKESICAKIYFLAGISNLVLVFSLVRDFGAIVMAYSVVTSEYIVTIAMLIAVIKLIKKFRT